MRSAKLREVARRYGLADENEPWQLVEIPALISVLADHAHTQQGPFLVLSKLREMLDHMVTHLTEPETPRWGN